MKIDTDEVFKVIGIVAIIIIVVISTINLGKFIGEKISSHSVNYIKHRIHHKYIYYQSLTRECYCTTEEYERLLTTLEPFCGCTYDKGNPVHIGDHYIDRDWLIQLR